MEEHAFAEGEESIRLLDQHRDDLVAEAREVLAQHPGVRLVGLVMSGDAREARDLHAQMARLGAPPVPPGAGVVMLMQRAQVLDLLRATTPQQLDWLESGDDKLPLVCVTAHGTRLGWAPLHRDRTG